MLTIVLVTCVCLAMAACGETPNDNAQSNVGEASNGQSADNTQGSGNIDAGYADNKDTGNKDSSTEQETNTPTDNRNENLDEQNEESHEHSYGEWTITTAPTCTEDGVETRTCSCGAYETRAIAHIGHVFGEWQTVKAATCEETGVQVRTCSKCGGIESKTLDMTFHTFGEWTTVEEATCTKEGLETRTCSVCRVEETRRIDKAAHTIEVDPAEPATCEGWGSTQGSHCSVCYAVLEEQISIPPLGHQGEWVVDLQPTCTERGVKHLDCTVCLQTVTESIPAIPHTYGEGQIVKEASCGIGMKRYTCQVCHREAVKIVPAAPGMTHDYGEDGFCTVCGEHAISEGWDFTISTFGDLKSELTRLNPLLTEALDELYEADDDTPIALIKGYRGTDSNVYLPSVYNGAMVLSAYFNTLGNGIKVKNDNAVAFTSYAFFSCIRLSCKNLTTLYIGPFDVPYIDSCPRLTTAIFSESVTDISENCLYGEEWLTNVTIPDSVTEIKSNAFYGCINLTDIDYRGTKEQWEAIDKADDWDEDTGNYTIHCTDGDIAKS